MSDLWSPKFFRGAIDGAKREVTNLNKALGLPADAETCFVGRIRQLEMLVEYYEKGWLVEAPALPTDSCGGDLPTNCFKCECPCNDHGGPLGVYNHPSNCDCDTPLGRIYMCEWCADQHHSDDAVWKAPFAS